MWLQQCTRRNIVYRDKIVIYPGITQSKCSWDICQDNQHIQGGMGQRYESGAFQTSRYPGVHWDRIPDSDET